MKHKYFNGVIACFIMLVLLSRSLDVAAGPRCQDARPTEQESLQLAKAMLPAVERLLGLLWNFSLLTGKAKDLSGRAFLLAALGIAASKLGDKQKALEYYNDALLECRKTNDPFVEALIHNAIGLDYDDSGQKAKALDEFNRALKISRNAGDLSLQAVALNNIGRLHGSTGEKRKALEYFARALSVTRSTDRTPEAFTLNNMGAVYDELGEKQKALECLNRALTLMEGLKNNAGTAAVLNNLGAVHNNIGEKQKALGYYDRALPLMRPWVGHAGEASLLNNVGIIYEELGEKEKALEFFNRALPLTQLVNYRFGEANTLHNIGTIYYSMGDVRKALENFNQALPILREIKDAFGETKTLSNIAMAYNNLGEKQKALERLEETLALTRIVKYRFGEAATLNNIGTIYYDLGEREKVREYLKAGLTKMREAGDRSGTAVILTNLGFVEADLGGPKKALKIFLKAIKAFDEIRTAATIEEIKIGLIGESPIAAYSHACLLFASLGQPIKAFNLSERARARTFLDQLGNTRPSTLKSTNPQLLHNEQESRLALAAREASLRRELSKPGSSVNSDVVRSLQAHLATEWREYEVLLTRLKLTNPEYAALRSIDTLELPALQKLLSKDVTLLSYVVTPRETLVFVITRDSFRMVEIPVKEGDLIKTITWFREFASLHDPQPQSLKQLYDWLIAPVKKYIKTSAVGVIPHGALHYLPFAALTDGQRYFGQEHTVFYLPSASVLPFIQQKRKPVGTQMLAVAQSRAQGMPFLQYADDEARAVADIFSTTPLTTGSASRAQFIKRTEDYSIFHIAAHAELNRSSPLFSRIVLGGDNGSGTLEVREVYDLNLSKASLVVLSACNTQLGARSKGDDIVGLNRAFIYAGTPTVIASLWTVDDESTSLLMKSFYGHLKQGMSKASALQAAQSEIRRKYPHPYYWAAFVLTGDPGKNTNDKDSLWRLPGSVVPPSGGRTSLRVDLPPEGGATKH